MTDNEIIDILKEKIRKLQEECNSLAEGSDYIIDKLIHKEITNNITKINSENKIINDCYHDIIQYENSNTDDKLRAIFIKLDNIQANISINDAEPLSLHEEIDISSNIDKYVDSFVEKGINKDNITVIENLYDYIKLIHDLEPNCLSRGQENCEWPLLPSALRRDNNNVQIYTDNEVKSMINEFKKTLAFYDKSYNRNRNGLEVQAYAQHYSIPTYLIDFTESHLISILFALENYTSDSCAVVYFVDAYQFNARKCKNNTIPNCSEEEDCNGGASSIFIKSDNVNERIHFQKGYFLKLPDNYEKDDVIVEIKDFCKIALIPKDYKYDILVDLFKLGLGFHNIFPDLDNTAKTIKFKNKIKGDACNG